MLTNILKSLCRKPKFNFFVKIFSVTVILEIQNILKILTFKNIHPIFFKKLSTFHESQRIIWMSKVLMSLLHATYLKI
jgi:hypothetical protein